MNLLLLRLRGITQFTEEPSLFTTDRMLVIIAIVVSFFGLFISLRYNRKTLKMTESHNKRTTRPALTLHKDLRDNGFTLKVTNSGLGPAIITKVEYNYKNKTFTTLEELLIEKIPNYLTSIIVQESYVKIFDDKEVLAVGYKEKIYKATFKNDMVIYQVASILTKTKIKMDFESVYGDPLVLNSPVVLLM